jgi:hypothetical protein
LEGSCQYVLNNITQKSHRLKSRDAREEREGASIRVNQSSAQGGERTIEADLALESSLHVPGRMKSEAEIDFSKAHLSVDNFTRLSTSPKWVDQRALANRVSGVSRPT